MLETHKTNTDEPCRRTQCLRVQCLWRPWSSSWQENAEPDRSLHLCHTSKQHHCLYSGMQTTMPPNIRCICRKLTHHRKSAEQIGYAGYQPNFYQKLAVIKFSYASLLVCLKFFQNLWHFRIHCDILFPTRPWHSISLFIPLRLELVTFNHKFTSQLQFILFKMSFIVHIKIRLSVAPVMHVFISHFSRISAKNVLSAVN